MMKSEYPGEAYMFDETLKSEERRSMSKMKKITEELSVFLLP